MGTYSLRRVGRERFGATIQNRRPAVEIESNRRLSPSVWSLRHLTDVFSDCVGMNASQRSVLTLYGQLALGMEKHLVVDARQVTRLLAEPTQLLRSEINLRNLS